MKVNSPSVFLLNEFKKRCLTQTKVARRMSVAVTQFNETIHGKRRITAEFAIKLE